MPRLIVYGVVIYSLRVIFVVLHPEKSFSDTDGVLPVLLYSSSFPILSQPFLTERFLMRLLPAEPLLAVEMVHEHRAPRGGGVPPEQAVVPDVVHVLFGVTPTHSWVKIVGVWVRVIWWHMTVQGSVRILPVCVHVRCFCGIRGPTCRFGRK